jgi:hypothetical protein
MAIAASHAPDRGSRVLWMALLPLAGFGALVWGLLHHSLPWRSAWTWVPRCVGRAWPAIAGIPDNR